MAKPAPTKLDQFVYQLISVRNASPKTANLKALEKKLIEEILATGETAGNYYQFSRHTASSIMAEVA